MTKIPFQIPMRSADGSLRWTCRPANRYPLGFQSEADALTAAALVIELDALPQQELDTPLANALVKQITTLSRKGFK